MLLITYNAAVVFSVRNSHAQKGNDWNVHKTNKTIHR